MREVLVDVMSTVLFSMLTVVVLYLAKQASMLAGAKMRDIEERLLAAKKKEEAYLFAKARETLEHIIYISVGAMEQLTARDLRMKVKLGMENPEKLNALALEVLENVKNTISPQVKASLNNYIKDLDGYIAAQIEDSLVEIKKYSSWPPAMNSNIIEELRHDEVDSEKAAGTKTEGSEVN